MSVNQDWDITKPIDHTLIADIPENIRGVIEATKIVLSREHSTPYTASEGCLHLAGSARAYIDSDVPLTTPDGVALPEVAATTTSNGRLAIATSGDANTLKVFISTSAGISTGWNDLTVAYATDAVNADNLVSDSDIDVNDNTIINIANDTYITAYNAAEDGQVNLIKAGRNVADDADVVILPDSTRLATDAAPVEDTDIVNKKYVDDQKYGDVDGAAAIVYTKYLTGNIINTASVQAVHGIASIDNILSVNTALFNTAYSVYIGPSAGAQAVAQAYNMSYDASNVNITGIGSEYNNGKYRVSIDYIL
jgi:hypothetical protein